MQVVEYVFQPHRDERGQLVALEEIKDIEIVRNDQERLCIQKIGFMV